MVVIALVATLLLTILWQYSTANRHCFLPARLSPDNQLEPQWTRILGCVALLPLYLVLSLQYSLHNDYNNYLNAFISIKAGSTTAIQDPICYWIFKGVGLLGLDFQFVLVIVYAISLIILAKCIYDYSSNWAVSILLFFSLFFVLAFLQLRQLPAVITVFFAYRYIYKKRFFAYCLCILIAAGFHSSAIIMLPFYFILRIKFKASYYAMIFSILAAANIFQRQILEFVTKTFLPRYYGRHEMFRNTILGKMDVAIIIIIFIVVMMYYVSTTKKQDINQIFINSFFIEFIMFFTCRWIPEFDRFGYYFYFPIIALVPNLLNCDTNKNQRRFMLIAVSALLAILCLYKYRSSPILTSYVSVFG